MTIKEKHAWCIERTGYPATILPPSLYKAMEADGQDMRWYVPNQPIPVNGNDPDHS